MADDKRERIWRCRSRAWTISREAGPAPQRIGCRDLQPIETVARFLSGE